MGFLFLGNVLEFQITERESSTDLCFLSLVRCSSAFIGHGSYSVCLRTSCLIISYHECLNTRHGNNTASSLEHPLHIDYTSRKSKMEHRKGEMATTDWG